MKDVNVFDVFRRLERRAGDGTGAGVGDKATVNDRFGTWTAGATAPLATRVRNVLVVLLVASSFGSRLSGWRATDGRVPQRCSEPIWVWRVG